MTNSFGYTTHTLKTTNDCTLAFEIYSKGNYTLLFTLLVWNLLEVQKLQIIFHKDMICRRNTEGNG